MATEVFDRHYFDDNYADEMRARAAAKGSANPDAVGFDMPNATTIVHLTDTPDGGVTISTTGDFVAYANKKFGCDRDGKVRRLLADATRNRALKAAQAESEAQQASRQQKAPERSAPRKQRSRFSFVKAVFGLMLVLAIGVLAVTSMMLEHTEMELAALESEIATMQAVQGDVIAEGTDALADFTGEAATLALCGKDSVEIYPAQEEEGHIVMEFLSAFAALWQS